MTPASDEFASAGLTPRLIEARQLLESVIAAHPEVLVATPVHTAAALLMQTPTPPPPITPGEPSLDVASDLRRLLAVLIAEHKSSESVIRAFWIASVAQHIREALENINTAVHGHPHEVRDNG